MEGKNGYLPCLIYIHVVYIPGVYHVFICHEYSWHITCPSGYVTGTEQTHLLKTWYTPGIETTCLFFPEIYVVYTLYVPLELYIPSIHLV
jgi:hypothetical protein